MTRSEIIQKVNGAILAVLGESIPDNAFDFSEELQLFQTGLELSSLDGVILIVELEKVFNVQWPNDLLILNESLTIGKVADTIQRLQQEQKGAT